MNGDRRWWFWWLLVAVLLVGPVASALSTTGELAVYGLVGVGAVAAVLTGLRVNRPARPAAWILLAVAAGFGTAAPLTWAIAPDATMLPGISWYDAFFLASYPALAAGLALLADRSGTSRWAGITETGIVLCTGTVLAWVLLYDPYVIDRDTPLGNPAVVAYPFLDALTTGLAIRLLVVQARLSRPHLIVLGAIALMATSDVRYFLQVTGGESLEGAMTLSVGAFIGAYALIGVAALHPGAAPAEPEPDATVGTWRLLILHVVLVLLGPIATAYAVERDRSADDFQPEDLFVPLTLTAAVAVLLVVRMALATRLAEKQATTLGQALAEQASLQESMRHQALHDTLTGLPHRRLLEEQLTLVAESGERRGALLLLDLDGFKDVNDRLGHTVGDELLVSVADRLRRLLGPGETLARPGGDEFAMLLPAAGAAEVKARADAVLTALRRPVEVTGHTLHVTGSIGIRRLEPRAGADELLSDADLALYAAKAAGKDRHELFDPRLRREQAERIRTVERLRVALEADEFTVHYQPIVALRSGASVGFEALVRWTPPGQDPIGPDKFIPAAEDSGLIVGLGEWVLRRACAEAAVWHRRYGTTIAVNVSPRQLAEPYFADRVRRALADSDLPAHALTVEITEGVLVRSGAHAELALTHLAELRADGVRVAIDDFGTGYSSLAYLRDLPIDILKIDKSFMPDDPGDAQQAALVRAVVDLARSLNLTTVAEGVETAHHAELLRTLGCDRGQGWLFGRPGPPTAVSIRLAAETTVTV
ncbi:bifunctional diguanylate cyclase/phosphodiesterase [Actinoplanes sp. Pm04-4]|uniref:Bifunctional diguanylate cyclase/phosphodiesterase n=1 Tax=Paractinoplanes pyxinae TaxID=2997416 RepID=A0ABT4B420_9ACTN|nr:bifunctional diguanylate cyclase/phosphodiesterase [Actinoplanes pyxinae]MCY1141244.1 bifunctional diguanylate cyclase/phosphodiesterase [Actinoplanes pyxinae]